MSAQPALGSSAIRKRSSASASGRRDALLVSSGPMLLVLAGMARLNPPVVVGLGLTLTAGAVPLVLRAVLRRWAGPSASMAVPTAAWTLTCLGVLTAERLVPGRGLVQAAWGLGGAVVCVVVAIGVSRHPAAAGRTTSLVLTLSGCVLLLLPFVPGLGISGLDAQRVAVGPLTGQPGELARPLLIAGAAMVLVDFGPALRAGRLRTVLIASWPLGVAVAVLVLSNDLGPVLVLGAAVLVMVLLSGLQRRQSLILLGTVGLGAAGAFLGVGKLRERVNQMLEPVLDDGRLQNTGAALQAIARGGWTGVGFDHGNSSTVANADNDFVLAAIGEERGVVTLIIIAVLLAVLTTSALNSALLARGAAPRLVAVGLTVAITVQAVYVTLATLTVVPVTGMVVPFLSRGGSALAGLWLALGVVVGVGARPSLGAFSGSDVAMTRRAARLRPVLLGAWTLVCCMLVVVVVLPPVPAPPSPSAPPVASRGDLLARDGTVLARSLTIGATPARAYTPDPGVVSALDADVAARLGCDPTWVQQLIDAQCSPNGVVSTIAPGVQATMQEALTGVVGDAVAIDATSGDILGMWSSDVGTPSVRGGDGLPAETYASAPGSSFKTITAAAVLTAGVDSTTPMRNEYTPPGGQAKIHNAGIQTLGGTLETALAASSNTSFAELATRVGGPAIAAAASHLTSWPETAGTAHGPAIDVGHELADPDALARTGFGQQNVRATPLDMAVVAATIAAGGRRPTPKLLAGSCVDNRYVADPAPAAPMVLTTAVAGRIADGMTLSVTRGAAPALADIQGPVAAKTGTADDGTGNYDGWVIAFAPVGNTKVAVAVRVMADIGNGHSRTGAQDAAPVAAKVLLAAGLALAQNVDPCARTGNGG